MGSNRSIFSSSSSSHHHHHNTPLCTRFHQIGALALIATTFFLTRLIDHQHSFSSSSHLSLSTDDGGFPLSWPDRGYGSRLSLKIYVYEEQEIDGLTELMRGRDGQISPGSCVKGQWGTQDSKPYEYGSTSSLSEPKYGFWGVLAKKAKSILEDDNIAEILETSGRTKPQVDTSTGDKRFDAQLPQRYNPVEANQLFRFLEANQLFSVLRNCNLYGRIPAYVGKAGTHLWKEIKHDNTVTWLAFWNDPINPKEFKYVFLAASSSLKGQSDREI